MSQPDGKSVIGMEVNGLILSQRLKHILSMLL